MTSPQRAITIRADVLNWGFVLVVATAAILIRHLHGADFRHYLEWCNVFLSRDIFAIQGEVAAPTGVPLTPWSFGTGLLMAVPDTLLGRSVGTDLGLLTFSRVTFFLTWLGVFLLLPIRFKTSLFWVIGSLLTIYFGSHAGYDSHHISSESVSTLLVIWLAVFLKLGDKRKDWHFYTFLVMGCLLCLCRLKLAPLVGAFILAWVYGAWRDLDRQTRATHFAIAFAMLLCTAVMIATANQWMTGDLLASPYTVGDAQFQAANLLRPRFLWEILFHPWHGLFVYHPLYLVGAAVLGYRVFKRKLSAIDCVTILAFAYVLYLHASWFCWWLGRSTFGMRAIAPLSVLLLIPILEELANRSSRKIGWLLVPPVIWSFLLYLQGTTNFASYDSLLQAQWRTFSGLFQDPATLGALAMGAVLFSLAYFVHVRGPHREFESKLQRVACPAAAATFALTFAVSVGVFYFAASEIRALVESERQWTKREFKEVNTYIRSAVVASLADYERIEGYEDEKEEIRGFLRRNPSIPYRVYLKERMGRKRLHAPMSR